MKRIRPKSIITTHENADFDALAAMIAAGKLYPQATLIAPTLLERQLSHSFTDSIIDRFGMVHPKNCNFSEVTLLILVDTRHQSRINHIKDTLNNHNISIHVYDHHPDSAHDIPALFSDIRPWGSTTAIITHCIQEKKIALSQDEATMLALGIYEDTGSFTFPSTTEHDLTATAYLVANGAQLSTIAELMSSDLSRQQVHMLDTLLNNALSHSFHGVLVTITEIVLEDFFGNFAHIVDKLMEIEKMKSVLCLAYMHDRIHLIVRSTIVQVDAGKICKYFGGGGHAFAASATIKNQTLAEVRTELTAILLSTIKPQMTVGSQMTSPAKCLAENTTLAQAEVIMNRYGLKAIPILETTSNNCIGILELHTANRAHGHHLGDLPVSEYMHHRFQTLSPHADLYEAIEIILKDRQRLIPIMDNKLVIGVLTRTDILRLLIDESLHMTEGIPYTQNHKERQIANAMQNTLPATLLATLFEIGNLADILQVQIFAVGGFVRDLLMRHQNLDIDLSVEGDGIAFANALAKLLNGRLQAHEKFKTAVISYTDANQQEAKIDVATTRLEYYESPGALPTVELASIKMDLYRRDFTINALAVQLNKKKFGILIDPFGAQRDIHNKSIAIMHSLSFIEDPTRILRAVRFEQRFGFKINHQTDRLIKNALSLAMIEKISGMRLFNEISHVFEEKKVTASLKRLQELEVLPAIHESFIMTPAKELLCDSCQEVLSWHTFLYQAVSPKKWIIFMLVLCLNIKFTEINSIVERFSFTEKQKKVFFKTRNTCRKASAKLVARYKEAAPSLSSLYEILLPLSLEAHLYLLAKHGQEHNIGQDISIFLTQLKEVTRDISGKDLQNLNYQPGPQIGKVLHAVLLAKIDKKVLTREEQLNYAVSLLEQTVQK